MEGIRHGLTDEQWFVFGPLMAEVGGAQRQPQVP